MLYETYYGIVPLGPYLVHHGIKGQKWGIRRFQNEDGTLTPEGRKRYGAFLRDNLPKEYPYGRPHAKKHLKQLADKGEFKIRSGGSGIIKKGANIQRVADENDKITGKRKYVSITDFDNWSYREDYQYIGLKNTKNPFVYNYEATKDISVAGHEVVRDYLMQKYGNKTLKSLVKDIENPFLVETPDKNEKSGYKKEYGKETTKEVLSIYGKTKLKDLIVPDADGILQNAVNKNGKKEDETWIRNRLSVARSAEYWMNRKSLYKTKFGNPTFKHFAKLGYDAIVDMEDYQYADYPVILLNPKKSIKLKSKENLFDYEKALAKKEDEKYVNKKIK